MKTTKHKKVLKVKKQASVAKLNKQFIKVYWPYIPLFIFVFVGMAFGYNWNSTTAVRIQHSSGVLAYATEMSSGGLLASTNVQRAQNGLKALTLNSKLSSAAQAKADDMVARNYWSHTTPDGKDPWVFIDAAGYSYQKAGENLAYGFDTSSETVVGWMNSPSHRANVLDTTFSEVGFGYANAAAFVGTGEETVVVAMYAYPPASTPAPTTQAPAATPAATAPKATSPTTQSTAPAAQPTKEDTVVATEATPTPEAKKVPADRINQAITSDTEIPAAQPTTRITKLQSITSGNAPWSAAVLSGGLVLIVGLWVVKHAYAVKRVFVNGEKFIVHHPLFDVAVLIIVGVSILLSQSSGVVK